MSKKRFFVVFFRNNVSETCICLFFVLFLSDLVKYVPVARIRRREQGSMVSACRWFEGHHPLLATMICKHRNCGFENMTP